MEIGSGFWARLFVGADAWSMRLSDDRLYVRRGSSLPAEIDLTAIQKVEVIRGSFWSTIVIHDGASVHRLPGAPTSNSPLFQQKSTGAIIQAVNRKIAASTDERVLAALNFDDFLDGHRYVANRDVEVWLQTFCSKTPQAKTLLALLRHPLMASEPSIAGQNSSIIRLHDLAAGNRKELRANNQEFLAQELKRRERLFDTVESQPLTDEQRQAALMMEDRNLVIAAAGSGKSSTVVAKIASALAAKFCEPNEILALAFNSSAAEELEKRSIARLSTLFEGSNQVVAQTFHRLGLDIITSVEGKRPDLAPWAGETQDNAGAVIEEIARELAANDAQFWLRWITLRAICARPNKELPRFESIADYDQYLVQVGEDRDGHKGIRTLNGELVKSMEELAIANWLFINGVPYEYEKSYKYDTADNEHRQYHPDFYYPEIDCYHEHFALDENGRAPSFFSGDYEQGVAWKRALHTSKSTALIETTSAKYRADTLFSDLQADLKARGQVFRPRPRKEIEDRLDELKVPSFAGFIRTFIVHAKSNDLTPAMLESKVASQRDRFRARAFLAVISSLMAAYEKRLRSLNCIDFEDMIMIAVRHIEAGRYVHPYKLILVDEFQDISRCRARLVKAMLDQKPDARLFAVGDDWQSIYRFAGADPSIMINFAKEFGVTRTSYLTRTFRSNQGIADVASAFVQANPDQIGKAVTAANPRKPSTVHVLEYTRNEEVEEFLESEIAAIANTARGRSVTAKVFILSRYRHLRPGGLAGWQRRYADAADISFLTLHRAKGLEADYVFILGANSGAVSFPSNVEDDPLLELVLPMPEKFKFAEERRLLYVGLTRAKHRSYIFTRRGSTSPFIGELLSATKEGQVVYRMGQPRPKTVRAEACDSCNGGVLREVVGKRGAFLGCSNYPVCKKTRALQDERARR